MLNTQILKSFACPMQPNAETHVMLLNLSVFIIPWKIMNLIISEVYIIT